MVTDCSLVTMVIAPANVKATTTILRDIWATKKVFEDLVAIFGGQIKDISCFGISVSIVGVLNKREAV